MLSVEEYLELNKKSPWYSKEYNSEAEREADKEKIREYNKQLVEYYPWLEPTNRWSGKKISRCAAGETGYWPKEPDALPEYDWDYTELDSMPDGWRIAFGEKMCHEIQMALLHAQELDPNGGYKESYITTNFDSDKIIPYVEGFQITEIKEKYGSLRFYCNSAPKEVYDVINKYEQLSSKICIMCGKPAHWETVSWISPYCDCCKSTLEAHEDFYDQFALISE